MYNDMYEGAIPRKNELMLKPVKGPVDRLGVMDDLYLEKLISSNTNEFTVFTTERILSVLMCSTSSIYPWDIKIIKKGNTLIMDKSETQSVFDIHVCENSADIPLQDGGDDRTPNSPAFLLAEAISVNDNIKLQVQNPKSSVHFKHGLDQQAEQPKSALGFAYRYMKWSLGEDVSIIIRATIDMVLQKGQANRTAERLESFPKELSDAALINIRALTECDPKIVVPGQVQVTTEEWRKSLETHCGTVLATEIRCGKNKISRWAVSSILAKVDQIKLAYVSRINPRSRDSHSILLVNSLNPETIAQNCSVNMSSCWGVVKAFVDYMRNTPDTIDGEYRLMRDMNKPLLRIYRCFKTEEELDAEI